jgi:hypothetical protein
LAEEAAPVAEASGNKSSWRYTGFNVHSLVQTKTKPEAEQAGIYMIRPA